MDYLKRSHRHPDGKKVERRLKNSIDIVEKFSQKNGFKLSTSKTSTLQLTKPASPPPIELRLGNIRIQKSETVEYLSLAFDSNFDSKAHIQQLNSECNETLNSMRKVSSTEEP